MEQTLFELIEAIQSNQNRPPGFYTMAEILEGMDLPTDTTGPHYQRVYTILTNMFENGQVEREKIGHNVFYRLTPQQLPASKMLSLSERKEKL